MSIQKFLYQNVFWRSVFYLSAFVLNILIARHFESAISGRFYYLVNLFAFVTLVASLSIESGIVYFSSSNKISGRALFNFSLFWTLLTGGIIFTLVNFTALLPASITAGDNSYYLLLFVCGNLLITFLNGLFYSANKFRLPNISAILINLLLIVIIFFVDKYQWLTNEKYMLLYFGSFFLQGVILSIIFRINLESKPVSRFPAIPKIYLLFKYCLIAFASNLVTFLYYRVDYWFVNRYASADELGNYIQVSRIAQMFFVLPAILASVVFPLTAGGRRQEVKDALLVISRSIIFFYSLACVVIIGVGWWGFPFVFGASFSKMYTPFLLLVPGILSLGSLYTFTAYYAGKDKVIVNLKGALLTLFVIATGDAIFIKKYGINAAAAISSIGYLVYHIYVVSIFKREYNVSFTECYLLKFSDLSKIKASFSKRNNTQ